MARRESGVAPVAGQERCLGQTDRQTTDRQTDGQVPLRHVAPSGWGGARRIPRRGICPRRAAVVAVSAVDMCHASSPRQRVLVRIGHRLSRGWRGGAGRGESCPAPHVSMGALLSCGRYVPLWDGTQRVTGERGGPFDAAEASWDGEGGRKDMAEPLRQCAGGSVDRWSL